MLMINQWNLNDTTATKNFLIVLLLLNTHSTAKLGKLEVDQNT